MTLRAVFHELLTDPRRMLIERWNWKAALFSSTFRALIFLSTNLTAGWKAATGAMLAEFLYRAACSGFYGAITQAFQQGQARVDRRTDDGILAALGFPLH